MRSCFITGILILYSVVALHSVGQNLVPNCDFDLYTSCPSGHSEFDKVESWFTPGEGTTDFCHECSGNEVTIPINLWGNQYPHSGGGYGHIISYYPYQGADYREYMAVELSCTLPPGEVFEVSFYYSCSDKSRYAIDGLGLHFSESPLVQNGLGVIQLGTAPHISNAPGNILMNQTGWSKISGSYLSQGGERFITIGNFLKDDELTIHNITGQSTRYSSFYIDMVSVVSVNDWLDLGNDTTVCSADVLILEADLPCDGEFLWNNGSKSSFIQVTEPGYYSVTVKLGCGNISDGINVSHYPVPSHRLPIDTVVCENSATVLDGGDFLSWRWNTGYTGQHLTVNDPGDYWLEATDSYGCVFRDTTSVVQMASPVSWLPGDTSLCLGDSLIVEAGPADKYHRFLWNDQSEDRRRTFKEDGIYWVEITNPCGSITGSLELSMINCETALWIPNAFTPDNDGRNDHFRAHGLNITDFALRIFNRWGEMVFESTDMEQGWDGRLRGEQCPEGAYIYIISYRATSIENAMPEAKKGTFLLIR